jgi:hypothetical protein
MTNPLGPTPAQGNTAWWPDYDEVHTAIGQLFSMVAALSPVAGPVNTVDGIAPDPSGNITIGPDDIGAMPSGYAPSFADMVPGTSIVVDKDPTTGFWPSGWDINGAAIYTNGAVDQAVRPTSRKDIVVSWRGLDPSPASVVSGTGGMLRGVDERLIPG